MNYIELINNVWKLREQGILTALEMDLYLCLVHKCNLFGWKNPFNQSTGYLAEYLGTNRHGIINRRNKLKQLGLIDFKDGITKSKSAMYTILRVEKDTQHYTHCSTQYDTQCYTQPLHKDKLNLNQTKPKKDTPLPPPGEKPPEAIANDKPKREKRFIAPTIAEVTAYCSERKSAVSPKRWFDYYQSNGWRVGKNPMKDWKAAVRTWEQNSYSNGTTPKHTADSRDKIAASLAADAARLDAEFKQRQEAGGSE